MFILNLIIIWACRLRRRRPVPSPQPVVVCPQSHKKSFLRSLFCGSGHIASRPCGLSTYNLTLGNGNGKRYEKLLQRRKGAKILSHTIDQIQEICVPKIPMARLIFIFPQHFVSFGAKNDCTIEYLFIIFQNGQILPSKPIAKSSVGAACQ